MPPPSGAPHSPSADDPLTTGADVGAAGVLMPWAAYHPGAHGGEKPGGDGGKKLGGDGGKKLGAGDGKKPAFTRVWSEADEVCILEALAAYTAAHGEEPSRSQLPAVLDGCVLDKSEFTVTEIYEKVRQLRKKYVKLRSAGGVRVPAGGADDGDKARKYELSRSIWGDHQGQASRATKATANANAAPGTRVRRGVEELRGLYPSLALAVDGITDDESLRPVLKRAFQLISDEKAHELDAKLKKQRAKEVQMTLNQSVVRNQVLDLLIRSMD